MSGCRILDDKDLEEQAVKLNRADMRLWQPETLGSGETRIFDRGFIKPFPKAFQARTYQDHLTISTTQTRPVYKNSASLIDRVRGILSTPIDKGERGAEPLDLEPKTSEQAQDSE